MNFYSRRRFLLTFGAGAAALLAGCGGSGSPGAKINHPLGGVSNDGGDSGSGGRSALLIGGTPSGAVYDELKKQYRISANGALALHDLLIVNASAFPGAALKTESNVQAAITQGKEIVFLDVTGEQKEAALQGRVATYTKNYSLSYDVQFQKDGNGRSGVRVVDLTGAAGQAVDLTKTGASRAVSAAHKPVLTTENAAAFVQLIQHRAVTPPTRQATGDTFGNFDGGAEYAHDTYIIPIISSVPAQDIVLNGATSTMPGQSAQIFTTHEVFSFWVNTGTNQAHGAFRAVLYSDGFIGCSPPVIRGTQDFNQTPATNTWAWYPVAVTQKVDMTATGVQGLINTSSPTVASGEKDSVSDGLDLNFSSGSAGISTSSSFSRTLDDWGVNPFISDAALTWTYFQQVPYKWPGFGDGNLDLPNFALSGFAWHNSLTSLANIANFQGAVTFNITLSGDFDAQVLWDEFHINGPVARTTVLRGTITNAANPLQLVASPADIPMPVMQ